MTKQELDNATDASPIYNIKSNFEYAWFPNHTVGGYYFRERPCYCKRCRDESDQDCFNLDYVGKWFHKVQKHKGKRVIQVKSVVEGGVEESDQE